MRSFDISDFRTHIFTTTLLGTADDDAMDGMALGAGEEVVDAKSALEVALTKEGPSLDEAKSDAGKSAAEFQADEEMEKKIEETGSVNVMDEVVSKVAAPPVADEDMSGGKDGALPGEVFSGGI